MHFEYNFVYCWPWTLAHELGPARLIEMILFLSPASPVHTHLYQVLFIDLGHSIQITAFAIFK